VQPSKVVGPARQVEFLGISFDTIEGTLTLSIQKIEELQSLLEEWLHVRKSSKRNLLRLVGKLSFASRVIRYGRAFTGRLISLAKSVEFLHYRIRISKAAREDILWWHDCLKAHNGVHLYSKSWADKDLIHLFSDASDSGVGAFLAPPVGEWFSQAFLGRLEFLSSLSINCRELAAVLMALVCWAPALSRKRVVCHIDNAAVCFILSKLYSPVEHLMLLVREWCMVAEFYDIDLVPTYISTLDNVDADDLSRLRVQEFRSRNPQASSTCTWPAFPASFTHLYHFSRFGYTSQTTGGDRARSQDPDDLQDSG
jgi:hypothetical protein